MEFLPPIPLIKRNWTGTTTDGLVKDKTTHDEWFFFRMGPSFQPFVNCSQTLFHLLPTIMVFHRFPCVFTHPGKHFPILV